MPHLQAETAAPSEKFQEAQTALAPLRSGQHVLVGSGAAEPQALVRALAAAGERLSDAEIIHLLTLGAAPYVNARFKGKFRHNALFIGPNVRAAVARGLADYTPSLLSEIPALIRSGRIPVDVALIEVTPPKGGVCSLGVSVDILKAAVETASYVVAQVNPSMPWTLGDSFIKEEEIGAFVMASEPLPKLAARRPNAAAQAIGRHVSRLVQDGSTLQIGIGAIPDAVLSALAAKRDLGVHSEMISDGVFKLWKSGALTGRSKTLKPGKIVASFAMGTRRLYAALDHNPAFEFYPSDYVNSPRVIAENDRMVAVNSALQVDLTGQVCAESLGPRFYSGFGGQADFIRGAAWSREGRSIIALPSTAGRGRVSRIAAALPEASGVVTTRADVDFVVTEYGIASLKGKTIRERALAMIGIAHPDFRRELAGGAAALGYLDSNHVLPPPAALYPAELESSARFGGEEVLFRPLKPVDERRLKDLFYSQSVETTRLRFGAALKTLGERKFQEMVAIDGRRSMALGAFARTGGRLRLVAVGRYNVLAGGRLAEASFAVHDGFQGRGIGTFLLDALTRVARSRGLKGFIARVLESNHRMLGLFRERYSRQETTPEGEATLRLKLLFSDWRGARERESAPSSYPGSRAK